MNPIARIAAVAMVATVAVAGSFYLFGRGQTGPGGEPTPGPTASPAPTRLMAGPLVFGTYQGPTLRVADIVAMVNADSSLTAADRTAIIDTFFEVKDKATWSASIELRGGQLTQRQTVDGTTVIGSVGRYAFPDDRTLIVTETIGGVDAVTEFELAVDGDSFTLHRTTPVESALEEFVTRIIFESGPFTLR